MMIAAERAVPARTDVLAWVFLIVAIALLNVGNLQLDETAKNDGLTLQTIFSLPFILALASLGSAFLFYVRALAQLPLAVAYPIMVGVTLVVVAVANYFLHASPLSFTQVFGLLMLFGGVALISTARRASAERH